MKKILCAALILAAMSSTAFAMPNDSILETPSTSFDMSDDSIVEQIISLFGEEEGNKVDKALLDGGTSDRHVRDNISTFVEKNGLIFDIDGLELDVPKYVDFNEVAKNECKDLLGAEEGAKFFESLRNDMFTKNVVKAKVNSKLLSLIMSNADPDFIRGQFFVLNEGRGGIYSQLLDEHTMAECRRTLGEADGNKLYKCLKDKDNNTIKNVAKVMNGAKFTSSAMYSALKNNNLQDSLDFNSIVKNNCYSDENTNGKAMSKDDAKELHELIKTGNLSGIRRNSRILNALFTNPVLSNTSNIKPDSSNFKNEKFYDYTDESYESSEN